MEKFKILAITLLGVLLSIVAVSCDKDDNDAPNVPDAPTPEVVKHLVAMDVNYEDEDDAYISIKYDGQDRISEVEINGSITRYAYSPDEIIVTEDGYGYKCIYKLKDGKIINSTDDERMNVTYKYSGDFLVEWRSLVGCYVTYKWSNGDLVSYRQDYSCFDDEPLIENVNIVYSEKYSYGKCPVTLGDLFYGLDQYLVCQVFFGRLPIHLPKQLNCKWTSKYEGQSISGSNGYYWDWELDADGYPAKLMERSVSSSGGHYEGTIKFTWQK